MRDYYEQRIFISYLEEIKGKSIPMPKILIQLIMRVPYLCRFETLYLWLLRINQEPIMEKTEVVEAVTFFMLKVGNTWYGPVNFLVMSTVVIGSPNHLFCGWKNLYL